MMITFKYFSEKEDFELELAGTVHNALNSPTLEKTVENRKTLCSHVEGNFVYH